MRTINITNPSIYKVSLSLVLILFFFTSNAQVEKLSLSEYGGNIDPNPRDFCELNSAVYFTAKNSNSNYVLWKMESDGKFVEISLSKLNGSIDPNPTFLTKNNGVLYFTAADITLHRMLWKLDSGGLNIIPLLENGASTNPYASNLFSYRNELFFTAKNRVGNFSFWKINTANEVVEINFEKYGGSLSPEPKYFKIFNENLYFNAKNIHGINTLWKYDGERFSEVTLPEEIIGANPDPKHLTASDDKLFFSATDSKSNRILWHLDANNTVVQYNLFNFGANRNPNPEDLCYTNNALYFRALDLYSTNHLWKLNLDSSVEKISLIDQGGAINSWPSNMISLDDDLYFRARDKYDNWNLWFISSVDKIKKIPFVYADGNENPTPTNFLKLGNKLIFKAKDKDDNYQLWKFNNNFITSVWNGAWDNGFPDRNTDVIINGHFELSNEMGHFECLDLDINEGASFAIQSNNTASVYGNILNKGVISVGSELNQVSGSIISYGEITNKETGQMMLEKMVSEDWNLISSPMLNFNYPNEGEFSIYTYDENLAENRVEWNMTPEFMNWENLNGYLMTTNTVQKPITFLGKFNYEDIKTPLNTNLTGFKLVGNPYPSAIDWNSAEWDDKGNISKTIYTYSTKQGNFTYYSENSGENYPGGVINKGSNIIAPAEAFFVLAKSRLGEFKMSKKAKVHQTQSKNIEKTYKAIDYCVLRVENEIYSDETSIRFIKEASFAFDHDYDAYKIFSFNTSTPQLYTIAGSALENNLAINSSEKIYSGLKIPVGFKAEEGNYTISAKELNISDFKVVLTDNKKNVDINISKSDYHFTHSQNDDLHRFTLKFATAVGIHETESLNAQIYTFKNELHINSPLNEELKLELFDLTGRKIRTEIFQKNFNKDFDFPTGSYLVKLTSKQVTKIQKVYIQN